MARRAGVANAAKTSPVSALGTLNTASDPPKFGCNFIELCR